MSKTIGGAAQAAQLQQKIKAAQQEGAIQGEAPSELQALAGVLNKALKPQTAAANCNTSEIQSLLIKVTTVLLDLQNTVQQNERHLAAVKQYAQNVDSGAATQINNLSQRVEALSEEICDLKQQGSDPELES